MPETPKQKGRRRIFSSVARFSPKEFQRITQEMYGQNLELVQINKVLSLLNALDRIVLEPDGGIEEACSKMIKAMVDDYSTSAFAMIFSKETATSREAPLQAWSANWSPDIDQEKVKKQVVALRPDADFAWQKVNNAIFTDNVGDLAALLQTEPAHLEQLAAHLHLTRFYAARLAGSNGVLGTLVQGFRDEGAKPDATLLGRVGEAISVAIDNKMLQEENIRIMFRLQRTNAKLRKLDETKDDFISMASHQLRTPLTSVKGYVSMVLDDDAGKINNQQRKLLSQAFISAERMVYLISDLLNVSRLRTGKFVIEPVRSNLAKVVEEEVSQLVETAKGRHVQLTYHKPEHFPVLMLDETKMRQVMMNFIDNALYYTPSGGHIEIRLVDNPTTIEFTVTDDGIGVPAHEQHHLFTKFYRAPNAKRARPDGTGLGLFMAKKVVIAQGGAIVFKSKENRGSTFGFTFAKDKLLPADEKTPPAATAA